jgi:hypothetical protein
MLLSLAWTFSIAQLVRTSVLRDVVFERAVPPWPYSSPACWEPCCCGRQREGAQGRQGLGSLRRVQGAVGAHC